VEVDLEDMTPYSDNEDNDYVEAVKEEKDMGGEKENTIILDGEKDLAEVKIGAEEKPIVKK
jgi:hypothetical protein